MKKAAAEAKKDDGDEWSNAGDLKPKDKGATEWHKKEDDVDDQAEIVSKSAASKRAPALGEDSKEDQQPPMRAGT